MNRRFATLALMLSACSTSTHATQPSTLGVTKTEKEMTALIDVPGPLTVETVVSADWIVARGGMINLDHPTAVAAGIEDGDEPIQLLFHAIRHPKFGLYIIDTGAELALRDDREHAALSGLVASVAGVDKMKVHAPLGEWLRAQQQPLAGVLLTHLHLDHICGMPDVPKGTAIYAGPGETEPHKFENLVARGVIDDELQGHTAIQEWRYTATEKVIDIFGDGSLWALWMPGHTPGTTAYLARTAEGPVLFTGDISHTVWGWEHDVEPGTFNGDADASRESFLALRTLFQAHPNMAVRLGHQSRSNQAISGR